MDRYYHPDIPPFAHQREALLAGWDRVGYAYLLEMGLGKSRVLLDNFCLLHERGDVDGLLIIASKGVYNNWTRVEDENPGEVQKWLWSRHQPGLQMYTWVSGRSTREAGIHARLLSPHPGGVRVLAVNAEAISSVPAARDLCMRFCRAHKTLVVVDESTLIKERTSARTKFITKIGERAAFRRILTGSPLTGSPSDLFSQFQFLEPGSLGFRSFMAFRARYCVMRDMHIGSRRIEVEQGTQNLDELAATLKKVSFRRRKEECLDLPPKIYEYREVELTKEQRTAYDELRTLAMTTLRGQEQVSTEQVITQLLRMHQVVCGHVKTDDGRVLRLDNNRIRVLEEMCDDAREPMIIWCNYRSDIAEVVAMLRKKWGEDSVAEWHGGVVREREAMESEFVRGKRMFMVASQQAGARGRTWTAARTVVYYSNNHDLELREQSEDRAHRIGQTGPVLYVDIVCRGTVDDRIISALRRKRDITRAVLEDGPRAWI